MKKTNIRVNNLFVVEDKGKYYVSDIDILEDWNLLLKKELKKYITKDISDKLDTLMETHSLQSNRTRVYKGGNWKDRVYWMAPGSRRFLDEDQDQDNLGFRCAMHRVGSPTAWE